MHMDKTVNVVETRIHKTKNQKGSTCHVATKVNYYLEISRLYCSYSTDDKEPPPRSWFRRLTVKFFLGRYLKS